MKVEDSGKDCLQQGWYRDHDRPFTRDVEGRFFIDKIKKEKA